MRRHRRTPGRALAQVETWVFDLDNTLYPARHNLFDQIDRRIGAFIAEALAVDPAEARRIQKAYFREHGTTLRGLMVNHDIDPAAFLDYVHDIAVDGVPPDPGLDRALGRLAGRKVIFTNGSLRHAERVVARLGVAHHFDGIFDIVAADYLPKPHDAAYRAMARVLAVDPRGAAMIEDIARNLVPAAALGMTTVWVRSGHDWGAEGSDGDHIDHVADDLAEWLTAVVDGDGGV